MIFLLKIYLGLSLKIIKTKPSRIVLNRHKRFEDMGFIKNAIVGVALYEGIKYLTKKNALGISKLDQIKEQAPEWLDKAKEVTADIKDGRIPQV